MNIALIFLSIYIFGLCFSTALLTYVYQPDASGAADNLSRDLFIDIILIVAWPVIASSLLLRKVIDRMRKQ